MEPWVHQQIKSATLVDLQTVNQNEEIFSVPCLINYRKGILYLHPLRSYDQSYINLKYNENASIYFENSSQTTPSFLLIKGKLTMIRSRETWDLVKQYWKNTFPFLQTYFDLQERYVHPGVDKALLLFIPSQILAWKNCDLEPIKFDMEIIYNELH